MTPAQIKVAVYAGALLLAWFFSRRSSAPASTTVGRRTTITEIEADVYNPNYGLTDAEIAANANPGVDPTVREAIDRSNRAIAEDNIINGIGE